ncbi:MAG: XrtA/PEP-CTERM system histidine kinase PrsK [Burkholderiaceae bacterium]
MTGSDTLHIAALGFGLCLVAMLGLLLHLRRAPQWLLGTWTMAVAASACAVWAAVGLAFAIDPSPGRWALLRWTDLARSAAWLSFALVLLMEGPRDAAGGGLRARSAAWAAVALVAAVGIGGLVSTPSPVDVATARDHSKLGWIASLGLAIAGLVCMEQLLRRVPDRRRWGIWPLAIALGGMYAFDLYLYTDAALLGGLDAASWSAQAAVSACAAPLLGVAATRTRQWSKPVAVSHGAAFHSTVLLASAVYLLAVAGLGYAVRQFGGVWGPALQVVLLAAALMVMGVLLTLGTFRSKLRVFVGKHFFTRRYDYREEWLRFTRLLSARSDASDIYVRCIQALADLVESTAGAVWILREGAFHQVSHWNAAAEGRAEPADGALAAFLERTGWVIDLVELRESPARYERLSLPEWLSSLPGARLVVPLAGGEGLIGFVVLMSPRVRIDVDWEVHDLLKAAGSEVAVLLRQVEANRALSEAEKFAAVNRRSAFMVHDLKNLVAQLSLMLKNADRHGDNPEFRSDMLDTVRHVVERMNLMLSQARLSTRPVQNPQGVDVAAISHRVCNAKKAQHPGLSCAATGPVHAVGHADRLEHVLAHVVQNAIDATAPSGIIRVTVRRAGASVAIEVEDNGVGMSPEFVQERLYRPFETTKDSGMGIGVYESQQYVASLGGKLHIESAQGLGTSVRITLPAADGGPAEALRAADMA